LKKNSYKKLSKKFYTRGAVTVAKELIGKIIIYNNNGSSLSGIIVETEAYTGRNDPASHSYIGKTKRNEIMFEAGGKAYVYFTYGNHYCFNVVTGKKNHGNAVLIRAVQPLEGIDLMIKNRGTEVIYNMTNGPGKFTKAFGIRKELYGADLTGNIIFLAEPGRKNIIKKGRSKRIGITKNTEKLYRFFMKDNPYVSRANISKILKHDHSQGSNKDISK
jgi:DNA-3-methyladenine glycosylase